MVAAAVTQAAPARPAAAAAGGWPTYHLDATRQANDTGEPAMAVHIPSGDWVFSSADAAVFASPIVYAGKVFVATENNSLYARDEATGAAVWTDIQVATPIPGNSTYIGCSSGQFGPTNGVTGTPAIDPSTGTLYVVMGTPVASAGHLSTFYLYAINSSNGAVLWNRALSFSDLDPKTQNQRGALGIANGYVYVPFGGRDGDCGGYHPHVVAVPLGGGSPLHYQPQTSGMNGGGIWAPSGLAIDGSGNVYVETGNGFEGNCSATWDHGDGVIKLSPALTELSSWAPSDWCSLNSADADIGSVAPMVLPNGDIFASGKSGDAWILDASNLGGVGGSPLFTAHIPGCPTSDAVFGGFAFDGARIYVPCDGGGLVALSYNGSAHSFSTAWQSSATAGYSGSPGAPIIAGGVAWVEDQGGGTVRGFDPATGAQRFSFALATGAHRFTTLAADGGRVFAMLNNGVQAVNLGSFTVAYTAYLPWYDRISSPGFIADDIHVVNPGGSPVLVNVSIPGRPGCVVSGDTIAAGADKHYTCSTGFGGPVVIQASATVHAAARVKYYQSFNEVAALPATAASTSLLFPWYDRISDLGFQNDNVHVVNPNGSPVTANVNIPGCGLISQSVPAGGSAIFSCGSGYGGPVTVNSTGGGVLATQRVQYYQSFNEVAAQPVSAASSTLWLGWYDVISNPGFRADNIHVVNPNGGPVTASVSIPGCSLAPQTIPAGGYGVFSCPGGIGGPIKITSSGAGVLASARVKYYQSFNEVSASAAAASSTWFPWYDRISDPGFQNDNVHVVNPNSSDVTANVTIPQCGLQSHAVPAGGYWIFNCAGYGGPVTVTSSGGPVVAFQRVQYYESFNEVRSQP